LPAAPILASELERLALVRPAPVHRTAGAGALRLALAPLAAGAVVVGSAAARRRGGKPLEPELT
jgi:hypothetical protein